MTVKIPDLNPVSTPLTGDEEFETVQNNLSKRVTAKQINDITTKAQVGLGNVTNDAQLKISANFSDVLDPAAARGNLSVYSIAQVDALVGANMPLISPATAGNFAVQTAGGELNDAGVAPSDFATAAQGALADSALQPGDIGSTVQAWSAQLDAFAGLASTGIVVRTGANAVAARTIQGGAGINATNGDGVAGDPSISVADGGITSAKLSFTPTKGNLLVGNGTAWIELGVETDDQVLTADAAEAAGVKWASAGGVFSESFESAPQTITSGGALTLVHGLSSQPKLYRAYLRNTTPEAGYSVGDEVAVGEMSFTNTSRGVSMVPDATNINVRYGATSSAFAVLDKSTGSITSVVNANWNLIIRAWA